MPEDFHDADVEAPELLNAVISETLRLDGAEPGTLPRIVPGRGLAVQGLFIPERWLRSPSHEQCAVTDEARAVYNPFGLSPHGCIGIHLAQTELRLVVAEFFLFFPGTQVAVSTTDESMGLENDFLISLRAHRCELVLPVLQ